MTSPFDGEWPEQLTARVVDPGPPVRIHGYAVADDLARHRSVSDVTYLALTGELPSEEQSRVFARTMVVLSAITVAEAPAHAAVLARICDGTTSAIIGTAAIVLAEQARWSVAEYRAGGGAHRDALSALETCGLTRDEQLEAVFVAARLPVVIAEALATPAGSFRDYPLNVPRFVYEEG
jgi:hypothetical protein